MTEKIYDRDSYVNSFDAKVVSCDKKGEGYGIILDRTAFFPEGGGQQSDTGMIGNSAVYDVQIEDGEIIHYSKTHPVVGSEVSCSIDWEKRFRRMQNHSGEHIVSGLIFKKYGYNNVGFHMGSDGVTVDIDHELTREQLLEIEEDANRAAVSDAVITAEYPSQDVLETLSYRSKIELDEDVRIVTIGTFDVCACCAPHVRTTGEIGIIKILDSENYKGGTRFRMLCGLDALDDYNDKFRNISGIGVLLSSKQTDAFKAVCRLSDELGEEKRLRGELKRELINLKISQIEDCEGNICFFDDKCDINDLRAVVNECINKCTGICAAFSGSDSKGYQYVMAGKDINLRERAAEINGALNGKGGGSAMIQGSVSAERSVIEKYIENFTVNEK